MTLGRIACALAVVAVLCVLGIFFFPGAEGPYSAVHGPVTALLSIRAAARLRVLIQAGVAALRCCLALSCVATGSLSLMSHISGEFLSPSPDNGTLAVLRC